MKKNLLKVLLPTMMVAALLTGCSKQTVTENVSEGTASQTESVSEETAKQTAEVTVDNKEEQAQVAEASDKAAELVTIEDVYDVNGLPEVFANHKALTIEYQSSDADGNVLGTSTSQIVLGDNGNVKYEATMDNGEDVYNVQAAQHGGIQYTLNKTTGEGTVAFSHPEFYLSYVQDTAYLPLYTTYTYTNVENSYQDDVLVVSADLENTGKVYMYVNPENKDLYSLVYDFNTGVTTNYSITYDNPVDLGVTCLDDALAKGTTTLTVNYKNDSYSEGETYEVPVNTEAYRLNREFDLYSNEECTDDSYLPMIEVGTEPVTVYAVYAN